MLKAEAMPTIAEKQALAADIKAACDDEDAAIDAMRQAVAQDPNLRGIARGVWLKHNRLHNLLGDAAVMLAADQGGTVEQWSGGQNKPKKQEA